MSFPKKQPPSPGPAALRVRKGRTGRVVATGKFVTRDEMDDRIEDAELNAIADERAGGPFVQVSLDDL